VRIDLGFNQRQQDRNVINNSGIDCGSVGRAVTSDAIHLCRMNNLHANQCDHKKIAKCLLKLPKNHFNRKIKKLTPLQELPYNEGDLA